MFYSKYSGKKKVPSSLKLQYNFPFDLSYKWRQVETRKDKWISCSRD